MRLVDLDEKVIATFYDEEREEWIRRTITIEDVLDSVCDDYTVSSSAQPDVPDINVGDMVSRQTAIDLLKKWSDGYSYIEVETNSAIRAFEEMPSAQPTYTDEEIQKMQDLESAEIEKAYQLGYEDGKKDAQPERKKGHWIPHHEENILDGSRGGVICSKCGWKTHNKMHLLMGCSYRFCPNCGCRMEGEEHD